MNANDEASTKLEPISSEKAVKNETEIIEDEPAEPTEPAVKETDDSNDTTDTNVEDIIQVPSELPPTLHERFMRIKEMVKDAIAAHHTFMVYGRARVIRECMLKRGWCEKFFRKNPNGRSSSEHFTVNSSPVMLLAGIGDLKDQQSERQLISRMLSNHTVDFLWNTGSDWPGWPSQDNKTTIFNRYCRAGFTSKVGLCSNVRQMHWYYEAGVANTLFPRCYNLCQGDQMHAFIEDFRFTACLSLLKWLVNMINAEGENAVRSPTGTVPLKALEFAIKRCSDYISAQSHEDIDQETERVWAHQWDQFISWYYQIVHSQSLFIRNSVPFQKFFLAAKHILKKMKKYCPQMDMDGVMNVWIMKPGNKSRGRGIVLLNKLEDVLTKMNPANKTDTRFVVQKYIERPLLIHSTKFDIRQWFVVTCAQPLTLWIYKESYLRFCSQKFCLTNFHESIHLCNHAIQCKYTNCGDRDPALPSDNMWDATTFKGFLKSQGHDKAWDELIYPGMKQGLVGSMLASQEAMDRRKNSFELYGADFMVMEDFSVWLIEINSHPDMSYSSKVTTRLCRQVLEDTIKVVIDFREDKNADTGQFELAYRQRMPSCQPYLGAALSLQGTRITTFEKKPTFTNQDSKVSLSSKSPMTCLTKKKSTVHNQIGPVIVDLIEELEIQLDQEFYAYYKVDSPKFRQALPATAPPRPLKTAILIDKQESTIKSALVGGGSNVKSKSAGVVQNNRINEKSGNSQKAASRTPRKLKTFTGSTNNNRTEMSPARETLISKIMAFQKQSSKLTPKSDKPNKVNQQKIIKTAVRDAIKKYKRSATLPTIPSEIPVLPSLITANRGNEVTTGKNKNRSVMPKKNTHQRKSKVLTDITDMYAVGLRLTK
ncbi:PREDICTED: tubulin glycylase 3A-like [Dufourea novaeangliae]|uniref:tubulin glycylase 3A-like n=1 Tax=Dufourea novaeangliae TaxID=178035 RepID=UPI0007672FAF|nr:PREDICTED: tubulin glycylase 3A-like [Dufourea novaeangliae]